MFMGIFEPSVPSGSGLSPVLGFARLFFSFDFWSISALDGFLVSCSSRSSLHYKKWLITFPAFLFTFPLLVQQ